MASHQAADVSHDTGSGHTIEDRVLATRELPHSGPFGRADNPDRAVGLSVDNAQNGLHLSSPACHAWRREMSSTDIYVGTLAKARSTAGSPWRASPVDILQKRPSVTGSAAGGRVLAGIRSDRLALRLPSRL